jgi:hypothetical protein
MTTTSKAPAFQRTGQLFSAAILAGVVSIALLVGVAPAAHADDVPPPSIPATAVPIITGSLHVGLTVAATPGTWTEPAASFTYQWLSNNVAIPGATNPRFVIPGSVYKDHLTVTVTATADGFSPTSYNSKTTAAIAAGTFSSVHPVITGTQRIGSTLTAATPGTYAVIRPSFSYQWYKSGHRIKGATHSTFTPSSTQYSKRLTVHVSAHSTGFTTKVEASAKTGRLAKGYFFAIMPTISTTARVGATLHVTRGTWASGSVKYHYRWYENGHPISHATSSTYKVPAAYLGRTILWRVSASKHDYYTRAANTSSQVIQLGLLSGVQASISGSPVVGQRLTAVAFDSTDARSYSWTRNGVDTGITSSTYTLTSADLGATLTVTVNGAKAAYTPATTTSNATAAVVAPFSTAATPKISGTTTVNDTLTATAGTWDAAATLSYTWLRNGHAISGATDTTYALTSADQGAKITVTVTGSAAGYQTTSKTSAATKAVIAAPPSTQYIRESESAFMQEVNTYRTNHGQPAYVAITDPTQCAFRFSMADGNSSETPAAAMIGNQNASTPTVNLLYTYPSPHWTAAVWSEIDAGNGDGFEGKISVYECAD